MGRALVGLADPAGPVDHEHVLAFAGSAAHDVLVERVVQHRLAAPYVEVLEKADVAVPTKLDRLVAADRLARLQATAALDPLGAALDRAGLQWAVMKGPVIASLMARPEHRSFNDLDLLVAGVDLERAIEVLHGEGVVELNRNWDAYVRHRVGEVPLLAGEVTVDLHWTLVGLGAHRATMSLDPAAMLERTRRRALGDTEVGMLDPEDQLLHLAIHTAMGGASRFDQLRDLAVVVDADPVDWDRFVVRARAAGVARLVANALDRADVVLGAGVPDEVVRSLGGGSIRVRRWFDGIGSRRPAQLLGGVVLPWRDSPRRQLRAAGLLLGDRVLGTIGRNRQWDFTDDSGELFAELDRGGATKRAEYLRGAVEWP